MQLGELGPQVTAHDQGIYPPPAGPDTLLSASGSAGALGGGHDAGTWDNLTNCQCEEAIATFERSTGRSPRLPRPARRRRPPHGADADFNRVAGRFHRHSGSDGWQRGTVARLRVQVHVVAYTGPRQTRDVGAARPAAARRRCSPRPAHRLGGRPGPAPPESPRPYTVTLAGPPEPPAKLKGSSQPEPPTRAAGGPALAGPPELNPEAAVENHR